MKVYYMNRIDEKLSDLPWFVTSLLKAGKENYLPQHFLTIAMITLYFLID